MTYAKPSPSTDAGDTLGTIITSKEKRDAIHLAVEPVYSTQELSPGDHIIYLGNGLVAKTQPGKGHGIVDPFLQHEVKPGEFFWFVMYPRQVRSLRHVWTHPAFEETQSESLPEGTQPSSEETEARSTIRTIADGLGVTTGELLEATRQYLEYGDYWNQGEKFDGEYIPPAFWNAYEVLFPEADLKDAHSFLTCSC